MSSAKARVIAFYLPQYHPIPENDVWWGKGFTEWLNVGKAKPLFKGHYQPKVPTELGYYDLRLPEIREQQAQLAKDAGIEGFCYWHYWFGNGQELLEKPFYEVLQTGKPDFPFCLGWANHSWTNKTWKNGKKFTKDGMLMEQKYPGEEDFILHFNTYLDAFKDSRYIRVDNKPLFLVFSPKEVTNVQSMLEIWNDLARKNGLDGIHFVGIENNFNLKNPSVEEKFSFKKLNLKNTSASVFYNEIFKLGFDAVNSRGRTRAEIHSKSYVKYYYYKILRKFFKIDPIATFDYGKIVKHLFVEEDKLENVYPTIIPNWDRTPRCGNGDTIWINSTPENFYKCIENALRIVEKKQSEHKLIFLQSWNEWGEGNYVEPDILYGNGYLESLRKALLND
jgi:hypothetical protein